ncbi:hypothetical protein QBC43DRAFT_347626 [Cladorrhinum sp. PSN259]|nr:hypothetical protein QBC43DRAFT_347626 [Cladorrhinum sp. PSN259]
MGFTVLIVGGSVSGLSLACMLEKFDIDYILLEGHAAVAPQLGASLGLLPSGLRILDQLGCYDQIRDIAGQTHYSMRIRLFSGKHWIDPRPTTISGKLEERIGYPQTFVDRQHVLQILFDSLKHKDRVLTNKRVECVEHGEGNVSVYTKDGSKYTGDILIGADGIHSTVRKEMWRIAHDAKSNLFQQDPLRNLQCESKCIFGISKRPPGVPLSPPQQIVAFFKNSNCVIVSAPEDRCYWFLFTPADKVYGIDIPRYTKDDELELAKKHYGDQLTETITFEDLYRHRLQTALVSIEDHVFSRWHYRRILTVGDAAHKLHPITASGGNGAMETTAVLVNTLVPALQQQHDKEGGWLTESDIEGIFSSVQAQRFKRAAEAVTGGRRSNSASIRETFVSKLFIEHFFPRFGQRMIFSGLVKDTMSAAYLTVLPLPERYTAAVQRHEAKKNPWLFWRSLGWGLGERGGGRFSSYQRCGKGGSQV